MVGLCAGSIQGYIMPSCGLRTVPEWIVDQRRERFRTPAQLLQLGGRTSTLKPYRRWNLAVLQFTWAVLSGSGQQTTSESPSRLTAIDPASDPGQSREDAEFFQKLSLGGEQGVLPRLDATADGL